MNAYNTGRVTIGRCYVPPPMPIRSIDAYTLQSALLDKRTAKAPTLMGRVLGAVWGWL